jgi:hypothetical protein
VHIGGAGPKYQLVTHVFYPTWQKISFLVRRVQTYHILLPVYVLENILLVDLVVSVMFAITIDLPTEMSNQEREFK